MKLPVICRSCHAILLFTALMTLDTALAQSSARKGARIRPAADPGSYSDGRPTALYRLDVHDQGPVLLHGDGPDSCDYLGARDVWVFSHQGKFFMHYDGAGSKGWLACLATSDDLLHWKRKGPVLDFGAPGSEDARSASYGSVYFDGKKWHMFYMGTPAVTAAPNFIPGFPYLTKKAEGPSPTGPWTKRYDIIPFHTAPGTYYAGSASPGHILKLGKEYRMFFAASTDAPIKRTLSYARTRNLDSAWLPDAAPILPPAEQIENSSVYYQPFDKTWWLFTDHVGIRNGTEYTDAVWVYWTKDPDHWDPANKAVVLDSSNCKWSPHVTGLPSVVQMGQRLALFYDGRAGQDMPSAIGANMRRDVGLAWIDLPIRREGEQNSLSIDSVRKGFLHPPANARPGVYWYFMDGNRSKAAMTADLESMKKAGIGNLIFLEVNVGIPRGPVDLLSDTWKDLFKHAVREGERLGIEITLGTGPGWAGSGGPWVKPEQSMQHLVASTTYVTGGFGDSARGRGPIVLPVPPPKRPYFGEEALTASLRKEWTDFYKDVAVLAFPTPPAKKKISDIDEKSLYYRAPYSSRPGVKQYLPANAVYPDWPKDALVAQEKIIDLTGRLRADGTLDWTPPPGNWTIMRFGARNNGAVTRPAPVPGLGFEVDKMDTTSLNVHLDKFVGELLERTGKLDAHASGGLKRLHIDSWEMGAQNWTPYFRSAFQQRRGYDPLPYYPVYDGVTVGSLAVSERFLWDLRQTCQELVLENHAGQVKKYSHRRGLQLSIEPYDMNPTADLELGSIADVPMCEFWSKGYGFNSSFSCIEATSIAHVNGISLVPAEAFTAQNDEGWRQYPGSMKDQGDWAFAAGINRFVFHTFQHQSLDPALKPGMTMGPYGVHWDRGQTWWSMADEYHRYISRCQFVLQQGRTVADVLYLTPEGAPHVFRPPSSAMTGDAVLPDRRGFNFDGCAPSQLYNAFVQDGCVVFPGGASYRLLVLPAFNTMTPALLDKIRWLVQEGAVVAGGPPVQSPGLSGYPACDVQLKKLAAELWGGLDEPAERAVRVYGKGKVFWGGDLSIAAVLGAGSLYPSYDQTADLLHGMGDHEDFQSAGSLRYTHRTGDGWDIYFVANRTGEPTTTEVMLQSTIGHPELWDPLTGSVRPLPQYSVRDGRTVISLAFEPFQSWLVVLRKDARPVAAGHGVNFPAARTVSTLQGPWVVSFDKKWGGPAKTIFDTLSDWTSHTDSGIRYYSGLAHYQKDFDLAGGNGRHLYLDLGTVKDMARVRLNGVDLGVVWTAPFRVEITKYVKARGNHLDIELANRWPNRLIGDEFRPDDGIKDEHWPEWLIKGLPRSSGRYTFSTYRPYNRDTPLLPSGLLGPVTIREMGY